jgi:hypothetical protein
MTSHRLRRALIVPLFALGLLVITAGLAAAHEGRHVGDYNLVVGFRTEPAYVGMLNGLDLRVEDHDGEPVEGLAPSLTAYLLYGEQAYELDVRAVWGQPGAYTADVIPTETGAYTFQISGTIEDLEFDEVFTAGPDTFSEVQSTSALEFPASNTTSENEDDGTETAMLFGIGGLIAGLIGLAAGIAGYMAASNARAANSRDIGEGVDPS